MSTSTSTFALALPLPLNPGSTSSQTIPLPPRKARNDTPSEMDDDEDEDDEDGMEVRGGGRGRKKRKVLGGGVGGGEGKGDWKYGMEISQMMFVFGEVQETQQDTVRLVEDVVRGQIIEIVTRARLLTHLRNSRALTAEDLIFLIRDDRGKVNRLRTYLSWKEVRKKAKEEEDGEPEVEDPGADKALGRGRKTMVKLPWELLTSFGDFLRGLPSKTGRGGEEGEEEDDEDELQAYEDSMQRLREADEITKKMTKDEYVHYSDCRQASFTYRKAKRFRDFINFSAYLDLKPHDDIVDILGFLAFEMVRSLCVTALEVRDRSERSHANVTPVIKPGGLKGVGMTPMKRKLTGGIAIGTGLVVDTPTKKTKFTNPVTSSLDVASPDMISPTNSLHPLPNVNTNTNTNTNTNEGPTQSNPMTTPKRKASNSVPVTQAQSQTARYPISLFAPPPSARQALMPCHVLEAFSQIQRNQAARRVGGMRNWRAGAGGRGRVALV